MKLPMNFVLSQNMLLMLHFFNGNVAVVVDDGRISMMDFCLDNLKAKRE